MLDRLNPESLFLAHLEWIEKVAAIVCHKNSVWGDDAEDFASLAKMKLIEGDYEAFRKFRGEAELTTYLTIVIVRLFHEYGRERWGRWRCSAAAERNGQLAKDLETLVYRDGFRLEEAGEKLRTAGRTTASDAELARLLAQLRTRSPLRPEQAGSELLDRVPADGSADGGVIAGEIEARRSVVLAALDGALDRLEPEERIIVRMHFVDGRKVADVARALRLDQKALYRRRRTRPSGRRDTWGAGLRKGPGSPPDAASKSGVRPQFPSGVMLRARAVVLLANLEGRTGAISIRERVAHAEWRGKTHAGAGDRLRRRLAFRYRRGQRQLAAVDFRGSP